MDKRVIVITGPTATGKTALSVALAEKLDGEIISADSMQIYRGMDIGTAKVSPEESRGIPHHMVDVADPGESFSVSRWVDMAAQCCEDIFARGKTPIITGGTGLYIDSLLSGRDFAAAPETDEALREKLSAEYDSIGGEAFREKLRLIDSERAEKLHPSDKKRLTRAMEVYLLTGETISAHDERTRALPPRYDSLRFALTYANRDTLYERIDRRVDMMAENGLFEEVEGLLRSGLEEGSTAMQAIGYKELAAYFAGRLSREEALDKIKQESRRYAKRQLTWLRRDSGIHWIYRDGAASPEEHIGEILELWLK
ncbi:MAG: tRNA (adenosine(37)-N6)-dimethylallyltransferase MiaA [Oscillospiraceae bacterium]|nr:tRNA (adenosine(37)-N6)-dimethylallyltransferase MiaA [Oscillospiraceae bacterium]